MKGYIRGMKTLCIFWPCFHGSGATRGNESPMVAPTEKAGPTSAILLSEMGTTSAIFDSSAGGSLNGNVLLGINRLFRFRGSKALDPTVDRIRE